MSPPPALHTFLDLKLPNQPLPHRMICHAVDENVASESDYVIINEIATGGCGVIWRARQTSLAREVAIKRIVDRRGSDPVSVSAFISEAIITGALAHPAILPIYEIAIDQEGCPFYSMPLMSGETWLDVLHFNSEEANLIILDHICDAMAFAHARGVIHCDLKPDNILIGPFGTVLVADWGLSLLLDRLRTYPLGMTFGTVEYLAPEQAIGNTSRLSVQTDIYQLGGMLHQIITGGPPHLPIGRLSAFDVARRNIIANAHHLGELADIAMKAMSTDPQDRFDSVNDFKKTLLGYRERVVSRILCESGNTTFAHARQSRADEDYLMAISQYQAAAIRWNGNSPAHSGLADARFSYAVMAADRGDLDLAHRMATSAHHPHAPSLITRLGLLRSARRSRERHLRFAKTMAFIGAIIGCIGLGCGLFISTTAHQAYVTATQERLQAEARLAEEEVLSAKSAHHWRPIFAETFEGTATNDLLTVMSGTWQATHGQFRQEGPTEGSFSFGIPLTNARLHLDIIGAGNLDIVWPLSETNQDHRSVVLSITDRSLHLSIPGILESSAVRNQAVAGAAAHLVIERVGYQCVIFLNGHRKIDTHLSDLELNTPQAVVSCRVIAHAHDIIDNLRIDKLDRASPAID